MVRKCKNNAAFIRSVMLHVHVRHIDHIILQIYLTSLSTNVYKLLVINIIYNMPMIT